MNSFEDTDQRLTALEIKSSYSDDLLEQLNLLVYRQQLQIDDDVDVQCAGVRRHDRWTRGDQIPRR